MFSTSRPLCAHSCGRSQVLLRHSLLLFSTTAAGLSLTCARSYLLTTQRPGLIEKLQEIQTAEATLLFRIRTKSFQNFALCLPRASCNNKVHVIEIGASETCPAHHLRRRAGVSERAELMSAGSKKPPRCLSGPLCVFPEDPGALPDPGIEPMFPVAPAMGGRFFTTEPPGKPYGILCTFGFVQLLSHVRLFVTPWAIPHQASLSFTNSQSLLKLMSI